jgi:iron(III) transport system permease protein
MVVATAKAGAAGARGSGFSVRYLLFTLLLAVLALIVLYPIALLGFNGFVVKTPGGGTAFGIDLWQETWRQPGLITAVGNTLRLVGTTTCLSLPIGILLAWVAARTDLPGKSLLSICCWGALFMPVLPVVLGWILLLDPHYGLLNKLAQNVFGLAAAPFDIFSFWGIVFAHLVTKSIAAKYIFLLPAFRNISATIEESSRVAGAGTFRTITRIVLPILLPAILITLVVSLIYGLESFEIELILGSPFGFNIYSTKIYQLIREEPPQFGMATVLGLAILVGMVPLILSERRIAGKRSYVTLSGNFRTGVLKLRRWRWPVFALVAAFCLVLTLVPLALLLTGTFMKIFGFFDIAEVFTTKNWQRVLNDAVFQSSLINTLELGLGASAVGTTLAAVVAYVAVRTKYPLRRVLDFLSWLPASIPGIILGLGMLWMFLTVPLFHPIYGTIGVLIIATVTASLTAGVQLIKSNMMQLGFDLEEASAILGGSWFYTFRRIVVPMLGQALLSVAVLIFAAAAANVANIAMLVSAENRPLSMLQVDYMVDGAYENAAVVGVVTMALTMGVGAVAVIFGKRMGFRT